MQPLPLLAALALSASPGIPPELARYLDAARRNNKNLEVTRAQSEQAAAQARQALAALLPALELRGGYTRNQYSAVVAMPTGRLVITPIHQFTANAALSSPLFDWRLLKNHSAAQAARDAARDSVDVSEATVALSVAEAYYQTIAGQGLLAASRRSLETARGNLELARLRFDAGTATVLDTERARADVARAEQNLVAAQRALAIARRSLASLTGEPQPNDLPEPEDLPRADDSEQRFVDLALENRPELAQQRALVRQAEATRQGGWDELVPGLSFLAQESWSNAAGFVGRQAYWTIGVTLDWRIGVLGPSPALDEGAALLRERRAALSQAELDVRDEVHRTWLDVRTNHARVEQAQVELSAARQALELARARYRAGSATSFELSQAQSDAFSAEANLVQARTDLAFSLLALRRAAGEKLE